MRTIGALLLFASCAYGGDVTLTWTAPGDDIDTGYAAQYDLRWAGDSTLLPLWSPTPPEGVEQALSEDTLTYGGPYPGIGDFPPPDTSGTTETYTLKGLLEGTYYVALKARDEAYNWSPISNIVRVEIDDSAPSAVVDLYWSRP